MRGEDLWWQRRPMESMRSCEGCDPKQRTGDGRFRATMVKRQADRAEGRGGGGVAVVGGGGGGSGDGGGGGGMVCVSGASLRTPYDSTPASYSARTAPSSTYGVYTVYHEHGQRAYNSGRGQPAGAGGCWLGLPLRLASLQTSQRAPGLVCNGDPWPPAGQWRAALAMICRAPRVSGRPSCTHFATSCTPRAHLSLGSVHHQTLRAGRANSYACFTYTRVCSLAICC
jgi:hypothetical protein